MQKAIIVVAQSPVGQPGMGRLIGYATTHGSQITHYKGSAKTTEFEIKTEAYFVDGRQVSDAKFERDMLARGRDFVDRFRTPEILYVPLPADIVAGEEAQAFARAEAEKRIAAWVDGCDPTKNLRELRSRPRVKPARW
jgi:hypothetical protein